MNHPDLQLKVTKERTADLVPYARNAKRHTTKQIEQICASVEEFGFADPVGVWTNADGESEIVEGHGRVLAAQKLGIEEVPVIHLDMLTDEQRRAYMLAHNQLTMSTGWNWNELGEEIFELSDEFEFGELGFSEADFSMFASGENDLSRLDIQAYVAAAEESLAAKVIVISYKEDEEGLLKSLLGVSDDKPLQKSYTVSSLLKACESRPLS